MAKPKIMFMVAASIDAPNESLYEATARGLVITSMKRDQSMPAAFSTSADSGSSTMAHRKKVVKPSVIPKPGITLGSRWPTFFMTGFSCRGLRGRARGNLGRPIDDQHRPARLGREQAAIGC